MRLAHCTCSLHVLITIITSSLIAHASKLAPPTYWLYTCSYIAAIKILAAIEFPSFSRLEALLEYKLSNPNQERNFKIRDI